MLMTTMTTKTIIAYTYTGFRKFDKNVEKCSSVGCSHKQ